VQRLVHEQFPELPFQTKSICPECMKVIDATVYEEDGKVMITKTCPEHGQVTDVYWGDAELYRKVTKWNYNRVKIENPRTEARQGCPFDCGLCTNHKTYTALALIDVTNRCNLRCPNTRCCPEDA